MDTSTDHLLSGLAAWGSRLQTTPPGIRPGAAQQSGPLAMLPLFSADLRPDLIPPLSGLKLGGVKRGYGNVELHNSASHGVALVPLHMGYIQDQAQNHALCRSAFVGAGQKLLLEDACCVQQSQGGFLESREQWFFILPATLREEALRLRGHKNYGKLWPAIAALNARLGLAERGHLEQVICGRRAYLNQYQSRFERHEAQTGAAFFMGDRMVGLELAPNPAYFEEVWMPLICFSYGTLCMEAEQPPSLRRAASRRSGKSRYQAKTSDMTAIKRPRALPFAARDLAQIRQCLADTRWERQRQLCDLIAAGPGGEFEKTEEERYLSLRLSTVEGPEWVGQIVEDKGRLVYASLTARSRYLSGAVDHC